MLTKGLSRKIFSILVALYPLTGVYKSFIPGIDLGTVLMLAFLLLNLKGIGRLDYCSPIFLYILIQTPVAALMFPETGISMVTVLLRYGKLMLTWLMVFFFGLKDNCYSEELTFRYIRNICFASTAFIILQRLFYFFGIILKNPFLFLSTNEAYMTGVVTQLYRPSAFFLEPSHFSAYAIAFLVYTLFKKDDLKQSLFLVVGVLCTGSGIGLVYCVGLFVIYLMIRFRKYFFRVAILTVLGILLLVILSQMTFFQQVVHRFLSDNAEGGGNAIEARIGTGYQIFAKKGILAQLFGSGYGNIPGGIFLNGITYLINTVGIAGLLLLAYTFFKCFRRGTKWIKIGVLALVALTVFHQTFAPAELVFYLCMYAVPSRQDPYRLLEAVGMDMIQKGNQQV